MKQQSFSNLEYENRKKKTRKDNLLETLEEILPWADWTEAVQPYYYHKRRGRKPVGIESMIRMYVMQEVFGLSAELAEDGIYDSFAMRNFMNLDFFEDTVPDASTLQRFRRLLKKAGLDVKFETEMNEILKAKSLRLRKGHAEDAWLMKVSKRKKRTAKPAAYNGKTSK